VRNTVSSSVGQNTMNLHTSPAQCATTLDAATRLDQYAERIMAAQSHFCYEVLNAGRLALLL